MGHSAGPQQGGGGGAAGGGAPSKGLLVQLRDLVVSLLPQKLKEIVEKGLLRALVVLVSIVIIVPTLVPLFAAFWLRMLGGVENPAIKGLRTAYLEVLHQGFSIEEVAARSNVRLDYLENFEFELEPKAPHHSKELKVGILPWQKAVIELRTVQFTAGKENCSLPEEDSALVSVELGGQPVRNLNRNYDKPITVSQRWWQEHAGQLVDESDDLRLSFSLTKPVKALSCGQVYIEGSLLVFKDVFPQTVTADAK